jgi:hypothetical protein
MFLESRVRPVHKADNFTAICEPTVYTVWDPQYLTTLWPPRPATKIFFNSFISNQNNLNSIS